MRYCITQPDFMMSTLNHKGIEWKITRVNGKAAFTHKTVRIFWDAEVDAYQTKNHLGQLLFQHDNPATCLEDARQRILDAYAQRYSPSWAPTEEEEIPVIWEEAA